MVPDADDPRWVRVITTECALGEVSLATRILVSQLRNEVRRNPAALRICIDTLRGYLRHHSDVGREVAQL